MEQNNRTISEFTRILPTTKGYNIKEDKRLLIPFIEAGWIGFTNQDREIIVHPKYSMYYGECYNDTDLIKVAEHYLYTIPQDRKNIKKDLKLLFGVINSKGEELIPLIYTSMYGPREGSSLYVVQNTNHCQGAIDSHNNVIIPFGKYAQMWGFYKGFAKVKAVVDYNASIPIYKFGVIDETGEEIIPIEYDEVWSFYDNNWYATRLRKGNKQYNFFFEDKEIKPYD